MVRAEKPAETPETQQVRVLAMGKLKHLLWGGLLLGALTACVASQPQSADAPADSAKPGWVHSPPQRHGYAYGVASAEIYGSEARALESAREKARADLLAAIRVEISSSVDYSKRASMEYQGAMSLQETLAQSINSKTKNVELAGLQISDTWVDAGGNEAWALAELDVATAVDSLLHDLEQIERRLLARGSGAGSDRLERVRSIKPSLTELAERRKILEQLGFLGAQGRINQQQRQAVEQLETEIASLLASLSIQLHATSAKAGQLQPVLAQALTDLGFNLVQGAADLRFDLLLESSQLTRNGLYYVDARASGQMNSAANRMLYVVNATTRAVSSDGTVANNKAVSELAHELAELLLESLYQKL